jgi:Tol biopolymer transport system component
MKLTARAPICVIAFVAALLAGASGGISATPVPAKLAFVSGNGNPDRVWLADVDGSHRHRLGPGDQPAVAPDGKLVAASLLGSTGSALVIYDAAGAAHRFFDGRKVSASAAAWSPDSRYLAAELFTNSPSPRDRSSALAIIDTTTWTLRTLANGYPCGASFAPGLTGRLAFAVARGSSICPTGAVNVFTIGADGTAKRQLTYDGRSLNPVWGAASIAYDHVTARRNDAPVFQVWLMRSDGTHQRQYTHLRVPTLLDGLVPLRFSADGTRLLARYEGQDTEQTWTIDLVTNRLRELKIGGQDIGPGGLSLDGRTVLADRGAFLNPSSSGTVETIPFSGGRANAVVAHAAQPSWNR